MAVVVTGFTDVSITTPLKGEGTLTLHPQDKGGVLELRGNNVTVKPLEPPKPKKETSGIKSVFCETGNRLANALKKSDFCDKLIKLLEKIFEAVVAILRSIGVQREVQEGFGSFTKGLKDARSVFGLWNVFRGVIPGAVCNVKNLASLATEKKDVKAFHATLKKERVYSGVIQRLLAAISELGTLLGAVTYIIAFTLCAPIRLVESHFKGLGETTRSIGAKFGFIMMVNHLGVLAACIADFIREGLTYSSQQLEDFCEALYKIFLIFFEKICEFAIDLITIFKCYAPPALKYTLGIVFSAVAVYRLWRETV